MNSTELARYYDTRNKKIETITVEKYKEYLEGKDKKLISEFVSNRLMSRYITPYKFCGEDFEEQYKNGFSMMASYCLLIETLQSFRNGWEDSKGKSKDAFTQFFTDNKLFSELNGKGTAIYISVRCGILHQGETTGGWRITRKSKKLYCEDTKQINAFQFGNALEKSVQDYREELEKAEWDSEIWNNFRKKMSRVISNCTPTSKN